MTTKQNIKTQLILSLLQAFRDAGFTAARVRDNSTLAVDVDPDDVEQSGLFLLKFSSPRGKFDWDESIAQYEKASQPIIEQEAERVANLIEEAQNKKDARMANMDG